MSRLLPLALATLLGCTLKVQLVPPPLTPTDTMDLAARARLNNLVACLPDNGTIKACIDNRESNTPAKGATP